MRYVFCIIFVILIVALVICVYKASRSTKDIAPSVEELLIWLIPPVAGNLLIIGSSWESLAVIGTYLYHVALDFTVFSLLRFTLAYCALQWPVKGLKTAVLSVLGVDVIQMLLNPVFGHAFATEPVIVEGTRYYRLIRHGGEHFHSAVIYGILLAVLVIFLIKMISSARIYVERYLVIFLSLVFLGIWETLYAFSDSFIDRAAISYGIFGVLVFYFSLYYRSRRVLDRMLSGIASEMTDALYFFDAVGRCIWANEMGLKVLGLQEDELDRAGQELKPYLQKAGNKKEEWTSTIALKEEDGLHYYSLEQKVIQDTKYRKAGFLLMVCDITREEKMIQKEMYLARHDALTGLYNRGYLFRRIHELLQDGRDYIVIFADVKDFKIVNDIFGRDFGDYALQKIGEMIRACAPPGALFGRIKSDTFGICQLAESFDEKTIYGMLSQFRVRRGEIEHHVLMHLGIYEVKEQDLDVSVMFDRARMALSTIKNDYQTLIAYYDEQMRKQMLWEQQISSEVTDALQSRQIRPYLQPLVDYSGRVIGAEALVRWYHPVHGLLMPSSFIPVFEKNGMIAQVDRYMWKCACEILTGLEDQTQFISVNVSPKDFYFMDVEKELSSLAAEYRIRPGRLRIEITETAMDTDAGNRIKMLTKLQEEGFIVEMDDFGSGYSSLNMLKDIPVNVLKIDMVFLNRTKDERKAEKILQNMISMSSDLGIQALTEGVETEDQYRLLAGMGCHYFQGYYFAKPMPVEDFEAFCRQNRANFSGEKN